MFHWPEPGVRYTRATLTLRRPTACQRSSGVTAVMRRRQHERLRLLRRVWMCGSGVHLEHLLHFLARQRGLRQHPPHRLLDHALRMLGEQDLERREPLVPHVARVAEVALLLHLAPRELNLLGVDDDDAVTAIHVRRERGLVLAPQDLGHAAREPAERLPGRVDHVPVVCHVLFAQAECVHSRDSQMRPGCALAANNTRGVRPCQPEGSTLSRVTSAAPRSPPWPGATCTAATRPAPGARSSFSIFIASTTTSPAPASTC